MAQQHTHQEPNLFDVAPRPKRKPSPPAQGGAVQKLIGVYVERYTARFGEPPVILKRDGAILKSLVGQFGLEKVDQRLRAFMGWDDSYVVESGFALTMFQSSWNRLAARCVTQQRQQSPGDDAVGKTQQYLRSLRAVPGRRASGS